MKNAHPVPTGVKMEVDLMIKQSDWAANFESCVNKLSEIINPIQQMKKIYKYVISLDKKQSHWMPDGAEILTVQWQIGTANLLCIWAIVDPDAKRVERHFEIFGTGWEYPYADRNYIGTFQEPGYVWHLFELLP